MARSLAAALLVLCGPLLGAPVAAAGQQVPDTTFRPPHSAPAYPAGEGPLVMIDEAHHNLHVAEGNYRPFVDLLRRDGYRVEPLRETFSRDALSRGDILVIANALAGENVEYWALPTPSAFAPHEIMAVREWVRAGGALLLVADHMPFPGAAEALAREFGAHFINGFAIDTVAWDPLVFRRSNGTLAPHPIREGRGSGGHVDSVTTFWGQAFRPLDGAAGSTCSLQPLLVLDTGVVTLQPDTAWRFTEETPTLAAGGWLQGAAVTYGDGRVVLLGEAAMITAQLTGPNRVPTGMNAPAAPQNARFVLNLMHWLSER